MGLIDKFKSFRMKYKTDAESVVKKESKQEEAARLTLEVKVLFSVGIVLLKPYDSQKPNTVKVPPEQIQIIKDFLNTDNELIRNNEFFVQVKDFLEGIVKSNDSGIELDGEYYRHTRMIEKLCYSFQGKEYWEEKEGRL